MSKRLNSQAGFTLLELIIVIISLLIIGAIVFFIGS
jgi:prepilin-type N-terminal cleavage/methylation domain-containing protein